MAAVAHEKARRWGRAFRRKTLAFRSLGTCPHGRARTRGGETGKAYDDHRLFIRHGGRGKLRDNSLLVQMETPAKGECRGNDRKCDDGAHN